MLGKWQPARPASGSQRGQWQPARTVAASADSGSQRGQWQPARTVAASAAGLSSQLASRYQPASQPTLSDRARRENGSQTSDQHSDQCDLRRDQCDLVGHSKSSALLPMQATALREYAEPAIQTMLGHFGQEIASEDDSATATTFIDAASAKRDAIPMMTALRSYGGLHFSSACEMLIRDYAEIFPEWVKLAKVACVIPVSSVPAERGFSLQNRIKTAQRSRLGKEESQGLCALQAAETH
ncbi:unnamed protein product [Gadus morhua 'NCC']